MSDAELVNLILNEAKRRHNLSTEAELAKELGVKPNAIWRWRNGMHLGKTFQLARLLAEQTVSHHEPLEIAA